MPRRTTLPLWTIPTSGPDGPHSAEELLTANKELQPWSEMLSIMTQARSRQLEILNRLRESGYLASGITRPGALTEWIEGMTSDAAMMFESFESVVNALDRYIARRLDEALTNASLQAVQSPGKPHGRGQYPTLTEIMRTVTREQDR